MSSKENKSFVYFLLDLNDKHDLLFFIEHKYSCICSNINYFPHDKE